DYSVLLLARDVLHAFPSSEIVLDMKTSQGVIDAIAAAGGRPLLWKTGHSLIKLKMRQIHALLGGEASGHMFYAENHFLDDALWAAAKLLAYLTWRRSSVRLELADVAPWYATPELRVPCRDEVKEAVVQRVAARYSKLPSLSIDGIRVQFPDGWGLVRASNTGPNLTLRFEAKSPARRDEIEADMTAAVRAELSVNG
ncbi:MAG: phosphomannomutase, partial [Chloroflexota bacterium]